MITRREFASVCSMLGLTQPCLAVGKRPYEFDSSVIVIGAGVAGMSVGHLLSQLGANYRILEAAPSYGGRVKTTHDFADFPIPLGGEWLHASAETLSQIVNSESVEVTTKLAPYQRKALYGKYKQGRLTTQRLGKYEDLKFVDETWLTFYQKYILPGIAKRMQFDTQIVEVDYSGNKVLMTDVLGKRYSADAAVVTVPPQIIKDGDIKFVPPLPKRKQKAFNDAYIWGGMKVFVEFKKKFYPAILEIEGTNNKKGQKMFYDAAYGQRSKKNVLGLFTVGEQAKPYQALGEDKLRDYILSELDQVFEGAASPNYVQHISQNWSNEKFIRQAYFADSGNWRLPPRMRESVGGRVFFAGDSYTDGEDWGSVHTAVQSSSEAVDQLLR